MSTTHFPLPWEARQDLRSPKNKAALPGLESAVDQWVGDWGIYAYGGKALIARIEEAPHRHLPTETANARFIVRACNCHETLVEALNRLLRWYATDHEAIGKARACNGTYLRSTDLRILMDSARAILAKAEGRDA